MKGLFLLLGLCFFVSNAQAQDCNGRTVKFKCLSPCEILIGAGCYVKDVGSKVLKGGGTILSAPFKSRFCFPKAQKWEWKPGYWIPGKLHRLPYKDRHPVEPIRIYRQKEKGWVHPMYYDSKATLTVV
tara:strand:- start:213 stop:596 length:384 start_codon:yes stop_codon:yes gene_type:complete